MTGSFISYQSKLVASSAPSKVTSVVVSAEVELARARSEMAAAVRIMVTGGREGA